MRGFFLYQILTYFLPQNPLHAYIFFILAFFPLQIKQKIKNKIKQFTVSKYQLQCTLSQVPIHLNMEVGCTNMQAMSWNTLEIYVGAYVMYSLYPWKYRVCTILSLQTSIQNKYPFHIWLNIKDLITLILMRNYFYALLSITW